MQKLTFITKETKKAGGACCGTVTTTDNTCSGDTARNILSCPSANRTAPRWITGAVPTPAGAVPQITAEWTVEDRWGMIKSRTGAYRMRYTVAPGLYALGEPGKDSDIFVTANYKLSFDILRRALTGHHAWVLVLDTKGINVWCAAGKGTFGTDELVKRITGARLDEIVGHRRLIVPQLGAVGVKAGEVHKRTGFRVSFGPVEARDIPAYVRAGYSKTREMTTMGFPMFDRMVLTPMEINPAMKKFPWFAAVVLLIFGLQPSGILFRPAWTGGLPFLLFGLVSVFAGAFVTPVLLPWIPGRSFAVKGWIMGMLSVLLVHQLDGMPVQGGAFGLAVVYLFFPAMTSYIALQFTGSTTFTGMSGVKKELKYGVPAYITATAISVVLLIAQKIREWSVL
jgi:CO dehydrogenase/acetyl-CoA synthase delta subunit